MNKVSIKTFHEFLTDEVAKEVRDRYWHYHILSEADLQSVVWQLIYDFIACVDSEFVHYKILNKPYLKKLGIHPDIVVFEDGKPWVIIELKESSKLKPARAKHDWKRLLNSKKELNAHRGYLFYVARYGPEKLFSGPKKRGKRFFFEVPIVLESMQPQQRIKKWEVEYKHWSKYTEHKKGGGSA